MGIYANSTISGVDEILSVAKEISSNTNGWDGWLNITMSLISIIVSLVTIAGVVMIYYEFKKRRISNSCQRKVVLDLIRHMFVNNVIAEIILEKLIYGMRPVDGVLARFAVLDSDTDLCKLSITDKSFDDIHQISLLLRNYNIAVACAEKHFDDASYPLTGKEDDIKEIMSRSMAITRKLITLAGKLGLDVDECAVVEHLVDYYAENDSYPGGYPLGIRKVCPKMRIATVKDYYSMLFLTRLFDHVKFSRAGRIKFI